MLRNYLSAALRNLLRNRAYAAVNLFGLALGFSAALLIALYVRDEFSYDRQFPHSDRTFQMGELIQPPGGVPLRTSVTAANIAPAMKLDFPEVEMVTRLNGASAAFRNARGEVSTTSAYWADSNFFQLFPMRALRGELQDALSRPDGIVLTRRAALRIFHREDVVDESVELNGEHTMRVAAVIADLPSNTHFNFEVLLPGVAAFSSLSTMDALSQSGAIKAENVYSYARLRPGAEINQVRAGLRAFADRHIAGEINGLRNASAYTFTLTPLTELHFLPRSIGATKPPGDPRTLNTLIGVAVLILIISSCNFISMMSARAARRAIEVGVRKAVGATGRQVAAQFMAECLLYAVMALVCAVTAVTAILPAFNGFLRRDIHVYYFSDPSLGLAMVGVTVLVGLLAGSYPSWVLARFRPSTVLRGIALLLPGGSGRIRSLLVVFQFAVLIALVAATWTVRRQIAFATEDRLRFPTNQIYLVAMTTPECPSAFVNESSKSDAVRKVTCVSSSALTQDRIGVVFYGEDNGLVAIRGAPIDYPFFDILRIKPLAGRLLSDQYGEDDMLRRDSVSIANPSVVINESAVHALGFDSPAAAVGQARRWSRGRIEGSEFKILDPAGSQIVGVVPDVSIGSVRDVIEPTVYYVDPKLSFVLMVELEGNRIPEGLRALKALWAKQNTGRPLEGMFLDQHINDQYSDITRQSVIFSAFAGVAIVVSALGLLGLAIFTAERQTKEIGLRKALGARRRDVLRLLGWRYARPVLLANVIAWPCAYLVMHRWLEGFAYHVNLDWGTFLGASGLALAIALATVTGHALMVARARPVDALRYE